MQAIFKAAKLNYIIMKFKHKESLVRMTFNNNASSNSDTSTHFPAFHPHKDNCCNCLKKEEKNP